MATVCRVSTKYGAGILKAGVCRAAGGLGLLELGAWGEDSAKVAQEERRKGEPSI